MKNRKYTSNLLLNNQQMIDIVGDELLDKVVQIMGIAPDETVHISPVYTSTKRERLRTSLAVALCMDDKPVAKETKTTVTEQRKAAQRVIKSLAYAEASLNKMHYKNLSELSSIAIISEKMRRQSLEEKPKPLDMYFQAQGIQAAKNGEENPNLFPFDTDLYEALRLLAKIKALASNACPPQQIVKTGKKTAIHSNELIIALCSIYKEFTGKTPISSCTSNDYEGKRKNKITGAIIPFLQAILPSTNYSRRTGDEALHKVLVELKEDALNHKSPNAGSMHHCPEIWR
jgi:hypothetical protein